MRVSLRACTDTHENRVRVCAVMCVHVCVCVEQRGGGGGGLPLGEDGAHDDIHALTLELRRHVLHGLAALGVLAEGPHDRLDFAQHDASVLQRTYRLQNLQYAACNLQFSA